VIINSSSQKIRFLIVGVINTSLDFGILFALKSIGVPTIPSNIISTTLAFSFSYVANKNYSFGAKKTNIRREILLFVLVTLFGLWIIQNLVISIVSLILEGSGLSQIIILFVAKILATGISLVWNYVLYSRLVFKN
jgi:putative flippase GtrA